MNIYKGESDEDESSGRFYKFLGTWEDKSYISESHRIKWKWCGKKQYSKKRVFFSRTGERGEVFLGERGKYNKHYDEK